MNTKKKNKTYTAFLVRDAGNRKYLNRVVYTGRAQGIWGRIGDSHVFYTEAQAQSCAGNINRRSPGRWPYAQVVAVRLRSGR